MIELSARGIAQGKTKRRNKKQDRAEDDFPFMRHNIFFYLFHPRILARCILKISKKPPMAR
jgi:hypothetical protein